MSKSEFVRSLQYGPVALSPYDVSQRLRVAHGCVSCYRGDPELGIEDFRGYMIRYPKSGPRTPDNPELYECVISLKQSVAWQNLTWIKEIIQILDRPEHRTKDRASLGHMLDNRDNGPVHKVGTPANVTADKDGLTLAKGCAVPLGYRQTLRAAKALSKRTPDQLERILPVPAEFIPQLLDKAFEDEFAAALLRCDAE